MKLEDATTETDTPTISRLVLRPWNKHKEARLIADRNERIAYWDGIGRAGMRDMMSWSDTVDESIKERFMDIMWEFRSVYANMRNGSALSKAISDKMVKIAMDANLLQLSTSSPVGHLFIIDKPKVRPEARIKTMEALEAAT